MGRHTTYNITPETIEELYYTEMPEDAKHIWLNCVLWVAQYYGCSKQLADIKVREWNKEYGHSPMKTVGFAKVGEKAIYEKNINRSEGQKRRLQDPVQRAKMLEHLSKVRKSTRGKKYKKHEKVETDRSDEIFDMPNFELNKHYEDIIV